MDNKALLLRIERFCVLFELTDTKFGVKALNDPNLVSDLRLGRELRSGTVSKLEKFMATGLKSRTR